MAAYYNEIDPYAAQWLRNLIAAGHIAPGDVDERSIEDVRPDDLRDYDQCHFFAGIGVWSHALRRAGWPDDRPVWTGSCPCQPFSAAGKGAGFNDERHLWPAWYWLIGECRPPVIFGEQVSSSAVEPWIDLVHADMEALDYSFGCLPFPSAGVGSPHIRDRAYWLAYADHARSQGRRGMCERAAERAARSSGVARGMGNAERVGAGRYAGTGARPEGWFDVRSVGDDARSSGAAGRLADTDSGSRRQGRALDGGRHSRGDALARPGSGGSGLPDGFEPVEPAGPTNGIWRNADWLLCRDGKWRPVEPGTFPLAHGAPSRVGRLRAYGNAINAEAATHFILAAQDILTT
ncbi:DNA cytosine methyltransferase [Burkholderia cenocepacia]|uniref:DNA cytosine methyltransferase n=1 Tax=Burkholderia cenocepacia TaxID=95486 RepID=UPI001B90BA6F|nr:DNA cytosine methyltransferase [Burkholderia cenocepacia]MBR8135110.1 DNA cytosine methyltransferase [Burkholderia cenocepacia]